MTKPLSPATQAVLDAIDGIGCPQWIAEATLRAVADQVVPEEPHPGESQFWDDEAKQEWQNNQHFRSQILAIAAELEGRP